MEAWQINELKEPSQERVGIQLPEPEYEALEEEPKKATRQVVVIEL